MNLSIGLLSEDIALFHALYRTSIKGGRDLIRLMFNEGDDITGLVDASYTSRVAEIYSVNLKELGIETDFDDEDTHIKVLNDSTIKKHKFKGKIVFCTDYQFYMMERYDEIREEILRANPVITTNRLNELVEQELKSRHFLNGKHKLLEFMNPPE